MLQAGRGARLEADIHGMAEAQARRELERLLSRAPRGVAEIVVIHGYSHGHTLRDMVRLRLRHPRIRSRVVGLNPGQTSLILKEIP